MPKPPSLLRRQGCGQSRAVDDPSFVTVDLQFDSLAKAEAFLAGLRAVWSRVTGTLIGSPRGRILEGVESKDY